MYQSAWAQLKRDPSKPLIISANKHFHRRIYKAVIKEKWLDSVFHLDLSFEGLSSKLTKKSDGDILTITLKIYKDTRPVLSFDDRNLFG